MIIFNCKDEETSENIKRIIDPVMNTDIYMYIASGTENIIYNAIRDPDTGRACYPDMLIRHNFTEKSISDSMLYTIADDAIRKFGSSRCFFLTVNNYEELVSFIERIKTVFDSDTPALSENDITFIRDFADKLMLSATMIHSFMNLMTYYRETGGNIYGLLTPFTLEYPLPVSTKNEGKQIYELIRNKILG